MLDLCIIGAPKSGTTSLFNWLDAHPRLQGAAPKETHFFMDSAHPLCGICGADYNSHGISSYSRFFLNDGTGTLRFEATTQYFYQETARDYLTSLEPKPIIVMLLREPADKILSSFRFTRDNLAYCDKSLTFNHYVNCLLDDKTTQLERFFHAEGSLYIAKRELLLSRYVEWLDWWQERLPKNKLRVIIFEELKQDPHTIMAHLSHALDIEDEFYDDFHFGKDNVTYPVGSQMVHRVLRPLGARLPGGAIKDSLKKKYLAWQKSRAIPDSDYQEGLDALRKYFLPWNHALARRYNLDIEHWWSQPSPSVKDTDEYKNSSIC